MPVLGQMPTVPQVVTAALQLPPSFPALPDDVTDRFSDMSDWENQVGQWYTEIQAVMQGISSQADTINTTAATVQSQAETIQDMQEQINSISTVVGGKSTITVGPTAPSTPNVGDFWLDTAANNTYYFWSGSAWEVESDGVLGAAITTEATTRATADGYLSGKYTLEVAAGNVVTGMNITSSTGGGTTISSVIFQASDFQIYNGSSGAPVFDASGGAVTLANTLVVSTAGKVYIGTGTFNNTNTNFYVDSSGNFSLSNQLSWNGSTLSVAGSITATSGTIGGWTISSSAITSSSLALNDNGTIVGGASGFGTGTGFWLGNNGSGTFEFYVGNSGTGIFFNGTTTYFGGSANVVAVGAGGLSVGTSGAVFGGQSAYNTGTGFWLGYQSGVYAFSIGNSSTAYLTFNGTSLAISGEITSSLGVIGGFTIGSTALSAGSGSSYIQLNSNSGAITIGTQSSTIYTLINYAGVLVTNASNINVLSAGVDGGGNGILTLAASGGSNIVTLGGSGVLTVETTNNVNNAFITGPNAGSVQTNYALTVINRDNATQHYGLFVGTNWQSTENSILTCANVAAVGGAVTTWFQVLGTGQVLFSSGGSGSPSIAFIGDLTTGIYYDSTPSLNFAVGGTRYFGMHSSKIVCYEALQLNNAYASGAPTVTGTLQILDDSGTTYYLAVATSP